MSKLKFRTRVVSTEPLTFMNFHGTPVLLGQLWVEVEHTPWAQSSGHTPLGTLPEGPSSHFSTLFYRYIIS